MAAAESLKERAAELDTYFRFVEIIEKDAPQLFIPSRRIHKNRNIDEDVVKILKANCFLLLYNVVESTVRDGFLEIYQAIETDGCSIRNLGPRMRALWMDAQFRRVKPLSATPDSYRAVARDMLQAVFDDLLAKLDVETLKMEGNLDAAHIRKICDAHGVSHRAPASAKGGERLLVIKQQRNALAHGSRSFVECGRDFTMTDLVGIKHQTLLYLRALLRNIASFTKRKAFLTA